MTPPDLRLIKRAKLGDAEAIALLMNQHLQNKGLVAHVVFQDPTLRIKIEGEQSPNQTASVQFIHRGITNLLPVGVREVHLSGGRINQPTYDWEHKFRVYPKPEFLETPTLEEVPLEPEREQPLDVDVVRQIDSALDQVVEPPAPPQPPSSSVIENIDASLILSDGYGGEFLLEVDSFAPVVEANNVTEDDNSHSDRPPDPDPEPIGESKPLTEEPTPSEDRISSFANITYSKVLAILTLVGLVYTALVSVLVGWRFYAASARKPLEIKTNYLVNEPSQNLANAAPTPAGSSFREGVNLAMRAVELTQTARTVNDWQRASDLWQSAELAMAKVPDDDPKYAIALQKIEEYRRNYRYANQRRLEAMAQ